MLISERGVGDGVGFAVIEGEELDGGV